MIVYVPALLLAGWEIYGRIYEDGAAPTPEIAAKNNEFTLDYSKLHRELYPERPRSDYYEGLTALLTDKNPQKAREHFERALATGVKTDEQLLYYYAQTLVMLKEDPAKVNEAVRNWRVNFPRSTYPDPRTARLSAHSPKSSGAVRPFPQAGETQ